MTWQLLEPSIPYRNDALVIDDDPDSSQWMNDKYVVQRRFLRAKDPEALPMVHLSIRNQDRSTKHDWRDFQRIKNQLAGPEYEGCEVYPQESRKVDTANQYHLFCFPFSLGFGLGDERMVTNHHTTSSVEPGAVQRDNEPIDGALNTAAELKAWETAHSQPEAQEAEHD